MRLECGHDHEYLECSKCRTEKNEKDVLRISLSVNGAEIVRRVSFLEIKQAKFPIEVAIASIEKPLNSLVQDIMEKSK